MPDVSSKRLPQVFPPNDQFAECSGCSTSNRRQFVQNAVAGVATLLGLSVINTSPAVAQVVALSVPADGVKGDTSYPLPAVDGVTIDGKNEVILARSAGSVYAFALACPHQNTELRWYAKDHRFQCPKHQSRYAPSGEFLNGRATRNMDRFSIRLDGTTVVVDSSKEIRSDEDPAKWAACVVKIPS